MAKIKNNIVIHGLSGMLGKQVVVRRQRNGGYILSAAPHHGERKVSEAERAHRERFRQAILYAKGAKEAPEYAEPAKARGQSSFNVAVADFLHPPEIQNIDLSSYKGGTGETIAITATDDVLVKTVGVLIAADDGALVEKGSAVRSTTNPNQWLYKTTTTAPSASVKIVVDVADLAGQVAELSEHT